MPRHHKNSSSTWPAVGQISQDSKQHATLIRDDVQRLLEFGTSSDSNPDGKECPYQALADFCTSVNTFLNNNPPSSLQEPRQPTESPRDGMNEPKTFVDPVNPPIDTYASWFSTYLAILMILINSEQ